MPQAVSGSSGSYPTNTSKSVARSVTVRAIGPSEPLISGQPSNMPLRLTRPAVGLIPASEFQVDGRRIDANPSSPTATVAKFAARPAPGPPDEPPTVRSNAYGFRVNPNSEPKVSPPPSSPRVALPKMIAPAFLSLSVTKASRSG